MARIPKQAPILTDHDLRVKRLIEHKAASVAEIAHALLMTSAQVRASIEKLTHPQRNEVFPVMMTTKEGRHNVYFPATALDRNEVRNALRTVRLNLTDTWDEMDSMDERVQLMLALDIYYKNLYNGLAGLANARKAD